MSWLTPKTLPNQKKAWSQQEVNDLAQAIYTRRPFKELVLFHVGIDTLLRSGDLVQRQVDDVITRNGDIREDYLIKQMKTGEHVRVVLHPPTREVLARYLWETKKQRGEFLFTSERTPYSPLSTRWMRELVKIWVELIGLEPEFYSCHSLRRTGAKFLYQRTDKDLEQVRIALGHSSIEATKYYLGITTDEVLETLRANPIWTNDSIIQTPGQESTESTNR